MIGLEELFEEIRDLPPAQQTEVIDLVARLRQDDLGEDLNANPVPLARFNAMIQGGLDDMAAGRVVDGPSAMAALRTKYNLPEVRN